MTKRLSAGALLVGLVVLVTAVAAFAELPDGREWVSKGVRDPMINHDLPLFFRSSAGTTWVRVHDPGMSPCDAADTANSPTGQTVEHIWCFEGANGDSSWPATSPAGDGADWNHWSKFAPPIEGPSKWHLTQRNTGPSGGTWNAWAGCDSVVGVTGWDNNDDACTDVSFWVFKEGYGDDWNYSLNLNLPAANTTADDGVLTFDLRYDTECHYDYLYLEYLDSGTDSWTAVVDTAGTPAVFNGVSGFFSGSNGGRHCGDDIFGMSDQNLAGDPVYGNSVFLTGVSFPLPAQAGGLSLRWRAFSDGAWSDADGRGDTDGIGAIDNVSVTWDSGANLLVDSFEDGLFAGFDTQTGAGTDNAAWMPGGLQGNTYDGWHLEFDPMYVNKGNTCTFSDDWMWAAKPATSAIPENEFSYFLVSPKIACSGWTGGVSEFSAYQCMLDGRQDYTNTHIRTYDSGLGAWSIWNDFDGFVIFAGCDFWNFNDFEELTPYLGAGIDSLQLGFEVLDASAPGTAAWGKHGSSQYLIDNLSVGEFNGEATVFTARGIDIYADTFSQSDPAHTPFLQNAEQGNWIGIPGNSRIFADSDSLTVNIADTNGITEANVVLWWRHDDATGPREVDQVWGSWFSKPMDLGTRDPLSTSDEGTYRQIIGNDTGVNNEDASGATGDGLIWKAGTTVQYYVLVMDNDVPSNAAYWPAAANPSDPGFPGYFEFSVLPFGTSTPSENHMILLVDDFTRNFLDFENSADYNPSGGAGIPPLGTFDSPVFDQPEDMVERALAKLYLPPGSDGEANPVWDKYDVQGGGASVQCEPRGTTIPSAGLNGYLDSLGNPNYDMIIWLQGNFALYSFADTTRIELGNFIEGGGNLIATGDDIANYLGTGGNNADSTIGFLQTYLGTSFPTINDDGTDERVLNVVGEPGSSMDGFLFGIYGECPIRRKFDRLTLATPASGSANSVLMRYSSTGTENTRPAVIKNVRTGSGGVGVLAGFDISAFFNDDTRACFINALVENDFTTMTDIVNDPPCATNGVDVPQVNPGYGFQLAAAAPNPFESSTSIKFSVASRTHVAIEVYNILGQKVRTLVNESLEPNSYVREWDGRSDDGAKVSSGIYFYKMVAGDFSDTKKAVLLK
jgi:hypothetical protein